MATLTRQSSPPDGWPVNISEDDALARLLALKSRTRWEKLDRPIKQSHVDLVVSFNVLYLFPI